MALPYPNPVAAPVRPACVSRLRIAGFKSFADPVTLDILPGLTGLVGPNGCGKSNVVDALRWAEMEDVIFASSATQPGLDEGVSRPDFGGRQLPLALR